MRHRRSTMRLDCVCPPRRLPPPPADAVCVTACLPCSALRCRTAPSLQAQVADIPVRVKPKALGAAEGGAPGEDVAAAAVSAAQGLDVKLGELRRAAKRAYDRVYYGDVLPPIGSFQISYARSAGIGSGRLAKRPEAALEAAAAARWWQL